MSINLLLLFLLSLLPTGSVFQYRVGQEFHFRFVSKTVRGEAIGRGTLILSLEQLFYNYYTTLKAAMASIDSRPLLAGERQVERNVELLTYGRPQPIRQTANRVVTIGQLLEQASKIK